MQWQGRQMNGDCSTAQEVVAQEKSSRQQGRLFYRAWQLISHSGTHLSGRYWQLTGREYNYVTLVYGDLLLNTFDGSYSTSERRTYIVSRIRRSILSVNKEQFYTENASVR